MDGALDSEPGADSLRSRPQFRTRQSAKLASARFLCTTFTPPPPPASSSDDLLPPASNPRLPHAFKVSDPRAPRPIYYLPYRLLPSQEDRLDDQLDAVRRARDAEQDKLDEARRDKVKALEEVRRRRSEREEEIERAERDERQKRRRELEERDEREREERAKRRNADGGGRMEVERDEGSALPVLAKENGAPTTEQASAPASSEAKDAQKEQSQEQEQVKGSAEAPAPSGDDVAMATDGARAKADGGSPAGGKEEEPATDGMKGGDGAAGAADDGAPAEGAAAGAGVDAKMDDELEY